MCVGGVVVVGFKHIKTEVTFVLVLFRVFYIRHNVFFHFWEKVRNGGLEN